MQNAMSGPAIANDPDVEPSKNDCFLNCTTVGEISECFCLLDAPFACVPTAGRRKLKHSSLLSDIHFQLTAKQLLFNRKPTLVDNLIFRNKSAILHKKMESARGRSTRRSGGASAKRNASDVDSENNEIQGSDGSLSKGKSIPAVKRLKLSGREDSSDRSTCSSASRNGSVDRNSEGHQKAKKKRKSEALRISNRLLQGSLRSGKKRSVIKENFQLINLKRKVSKKEKEPVVERKKPVRAPMKNLNKASEVSESKRSDTLDKSAKTKKKLPQTLESTKTEIKCDQSSDKSITMKKKRRKKSDSMMWLKKPKKAAPDVKESDIVSIKSEGERDEPDDSGLGSEVRLDMPTLIKVKDDSQDKYTPQSSPVSAIGKCSSPILDPQTNQKSEGKPIWNIESFEEFDNKQRAEDDIKVDAPAVVKVTEEPEDCETLTDVKLDETDSAETSDTDVDRYQKDVDKSVNDVTHPQVDSEPNTTKVTTSSLNDELLLNIPQGSPVNDECSVSPIESLTVPKESLTVPVEHLSQPSESPETFSQHLWNVNELNKCSENHVNIVEVPSESLKDSHFVKETNYLNCSETNNVVLSDSVVPESVPEDCDINVCSEKNEIPESTTVLTDGVLLRMEHNEVVEDCIKPESASLSIKLNGLNNISSDEHQSPTVQVEPSLPTGESENVEPEITSSIVTSPDHQSKDDEESINLNLDESITLANDESCDEESFPTDNTFDLTETMFSKNSVQEEESSIKEVDSRGAEEKDPPGLLPQVESEKVANEEESNQMLLEVNKEAIEEEAPPVLPREDNRVTEVTEETISSHLEESSPSETTEVKEEQAEVKLNGDIKGEPIEREALKNDLLKALGLQSLRNFSPPLVNVPIVEQPKPKVQPQSAYTGTLKAVIKLNRGADKKSRSMVFKGPEEKQEKLEYTITSEVGSGLTGVPITHLADLSGSKKSKDKVVTPDYESGNNSNQLDGTPYSESADSGDEKQDNKESSLVIPEKSSSFSIHPERLCSDVCCYCFGKFGSLDTPCHVAQLKGEERQQKILKNEPYLTLESCLCDACYRYVDRKANCTNQGKTKRKPPMASVCCVTDCNEAATHTVKRKWLLKIRRSLSHKFEIDIEKHNSVYHPLCSNHHYWVDYYMVCGICRKRLNRNHLFTLGSETDRLNLLLAEDGIPARLSDKLFLCKLCRYYTNMRLKYCDPSSIPTSSLPFYKNYRKKILASLDVPVSDSDEEVAMDEKPKDNGAGEKDQDMEDVMSLSGLATLLGDQPEQQPRIQVKFGNVNIGTLSNLNIGQGRQEDRGQYKRGESPIPLSANFDFQGPSTSDGSWEKVTSTLQFDKKTKQLWQDLQRPYGNQSSFLRHLVMLEKLWRGGSLVLAGDVDPRAAKYITSVQTRIKSLEGKSEGNIPNPVIKPDEPKPVPPVISRVQAQASVAHLRPVAKPASPAPPAQYHPLIATGEIEVTPVNRQKSEKPVVSKGTLIMQRPASTPSSSSTSNLTITNVTSLARPKPDKALLNKAKNLVRMVNPQNVTRGVQNPNPRPVLRPLPPMNRWRRPPHHQLYPTSTVLQQIQAQLNASPALKAQISSGQFNTGPSSLQAQLQSPPLHPLQSLQRMYTSPAPPPPYPSPSPPRVPSPSTLPRLPPSLTLTHLPPSNPHSITLPSSGITIEKHSDTFHVPPLLPPEKPIITVFREPLPDPSYS